MPIVDNTPYYYPRKGTYTPEPTAKSTTIEPLKMNLQ